MVELPHVLVGTALAAKIDNPLLGISLALTSHFVLDLIPHANPHIYTEIKKSGKLNSKTVMWVVLDSTAALIAGLFIASQSLPDFTKFFVVIMGAFVAVLPDLIEAPYYFLGIRHPLMVKIVEFEHSLQGRLPAIPGAITQIVVSLAALWWVFR